MKLKRFEMFDPSEREYLNVNPEDVSAIREYHDRRAYGGPQKKPVSKITMKSGKEFVVCGHVAEELQEDV